MQVVITGFWKIRSFLFLVVLVTSYAATAQGSNGQNIRGNIVDDVSRTNIEGITVTVISGASIKTTSTDAKGNFLLAKMPPGRYSLRISGVGYEEQTLSEVLVTTGKEVILNIQLTEKFTDLNTVTVTARSSRTLNNEMAVVSSNAFNPSDTRRFAGAVGDPSRMISNVAGVVNGSDTRNDIVVRGNSPAGLLWQMEGMDIPNPNHYGSLSSTGGPVSILNSNNLGRSDFFTGAFAAQYGNALASVFDLKMRNGNASKTEFIGEISFTGVEAGVEGPFSKNSDASYLFNYRYSTVGILNELGFNIGTGTAAPQYQDVSFKINIPISKKSKLGIWGMGGPSRISFYGNDSDTTNDQNLYGNENENTLTKYFTGMAGVTLETNFSSRTYGKLSAGVTHTMEDIRHDSISVLSREAFRDAEFNYKTNRFSLNYFLSHKINAKNSIVLGLNNTLYHFDLYNKRVYGGGALTLIRLDQQETTALLQAYSQWKHRFTEKLSLNTGLHFQTLTLNGSAALEPRIGLKYDHSPSHSVTFGYGMHSQMQSPVIYFNRTYNATGFTSTNKDLGFSRSQHIIAGYQYRFTPSVNIKTELYYQALRDIPVEQFASGFSMLNEGANFGITMRDSLTNRGSGRNYGVELTVEKYFNRNYYFLITGSLFNSRYKGSDGVERNTAFNTGYVYNILAGKDFILGKNKSVFSVNFRVGGVGGRYTSPVDIAASEQSNETEYDEITAPYSIRLSPYFRADLKFGYRRNYAKSTMEFGIDLRNFTNNENIFVQSYNRRTKAVVSQNQQGFLPVPYFRYTF